MSVQKKPVASQAIDSLDEIDKIMNEIEELQQGMSVDHVEAKATATQPVGEPIEAASEDSNSMEEFKAGSGDVSMEETLANLKDDEPSGPNLIDQTIQAEAAASEAHEEGSDLLDDDELLDEAEAEALQQAIEEEEAQIAEAVEAVLEESEAEEVEVVAPQRLQDTQRRKRPEPVAPPSKQMSEGQPGSVSMTLAGNMTLKLRYEFEGQEVRIGFRDGALTVELSDGTEFKIPVRRNSLRKVG